ncbi:UvrD-helicase domain-containing protein [Paenibacillus sp. WQ 127069]|uniref:DNA 3'-5' helicase n=1 Tax=Paenibacillus baimaensis TaxID=2982185 RepID=A0ABT2URZ9_9BACL|nr:UvrD-helicase domain-containing protein [Paenibacillus sp. WQ 127069]MCU6796836.1 UvrD-helicase domain-containing protein [Paenibacillus sp. WQ 127069]
MFKQFVTQDDDDARLRIGSDLDTTFMVEAGAGSGKTTSIIGRMIALVRTRKAQARDIAAITFTNKAASELMGRFRIKLEQECARAPQGVERDALEEALRQIPECFIGTIHAFCGRLLRERPIEAKLDPSFQEMDDRQDQEFRDQCWDDYLDEMRSEGGKKTQAEEGAQGEAASWCAEASIEALAALQVNVEDLRAVYNRVAEYEDVEIYTEQVARPGFDRLRDSLFPLLEEASPYIPTMEPAKDWDVLQKTIRDAVGHIRNKNMADDINMLILAKLFDRNLSVTLNRWTDPKMAKQFKEQFHDWQTYILRPFLQEWREFLHPKLIAFVLPAIRYCTQKRMEAGKLNFQDLLMKAAELLRTYPEVRTYFGKRYSRLFVDEFQDTDPIQAEMMMLLTGSNEAEWNWRKQLPRHGSLFVVGDPKQSIYRFRRADISTYNFVKQRIEQCGEVLQLTRNFRSVKAIGDFVNYAFESKFTLKGEESECQAPFIEMITQHPNPGGRTALHGVYTLTVPKQERDRQVDIALYDAERIAQFVAWACGGGLLIHDKTDDEGKPISRPARPGDFLILLKFRKFISLYAGQLEKYGIVSDTSGSLVVFEELRVLYQLALTLNDPTDRVPLLAVLRGMLFGLSDDALYHYCQEGGSISLHTIADPARLSVKSVKVDQVLHKLRQYMEWVKALPALSAFTRIIDDIGLVAAAAVGDSGAIRSGTLIKLLEVLQGDAEASIEWPALTEWLHRLTDSESLEAASLFSGSADAVRIMNLHKAKGLEASIVMMACPCGDNDHDAQEHIDRLAEPSLGYFTISKQKDMFTSEVVAQPVGWTRHAEREREFMNAETDRLLYVAATRAKQLLIVSQYPSRPAIDPWSLLSVSLQQQLELELIHVDPVQPEELAMVPDIASSVDEWQKRLDSGSVPSYQLGSVTGLAKSSSDIVIERSSGGKGMAYGSLIHRCLQALGEGMDDSDLTDFCRMAVEEEGVEEKWLELAVETVLKVAASTLWKRSMSARRRYHEFSFMISRRIAATDENKRVQDSSFQGGSLADSVTTILRGVIDLVFEEEEGWVIVDFKTDRYELPNEQQLVDFYKSQVLAYVEEWERTIGGKVKEAGLYFIDRDRYLLNYGDTHG